MIDSILLGLGLIIGLGILLQWIARIIKIPGIILLLPAGMIVGPVLGLVNPNIIFGNSFYDLITIGVGLLLFKGGFELNISKIQSDDKTVIWRLIIIGVIITFSIGAFSALLLFNIPLIFALLIAAILIVSGPTVIGPLLKVVRPKEPLGRILLWEGIIVDPIGASLGVAILSFITSQISYPFVGMFLTIVTGIAIGVFFAFLYGASERSGLIPPNLNPLVALMFAIIAIVSAQLILSEAGLFAALAMGFALGNQKITPVVGVQKFNEIIEPFIIGILFIMLAALVNLQALVQYLLPALALVAIYILIARPLVGFITTQGLDFNLSQRTFIGAMAPRGIVAAATSSLFAITLSNMGVNFPQLFPVVFTVILGTVVIYGLSGPILSRRLNLSLPDRNAVALIGDQPWVSELAEALNHAGVGVMHISSQADYIKKFFTREEVPYLAYSGSIAELGDDEIIDDAHGFKNLIEWVIIATNNLDVINIVKEVFNPEIGFNHVAIFGRKREIQDRVIIGGGKNIFNVLSKTPFGLFAKNEDELLDILDSGGRFKILEYGNDLGEEKRIFLRINGNGTLAVPGTYEPLEDGESFIVITPKN